jgi:cell division protein FtsL
MPFPVLLDNTILNVLLAMLSPIEKALLVDFVVLVIVAVFGFAIVSTLMAVTKSICRRDIFSYESEGTSKNAIAQEVCCLGQEEWQARPLDVVSFVISSC